MYSHEGEKKTSSMSDREGNVNVYHKEFVKAHDGYIIIYECRGNIFHSIYESVFTETDLTK